jgi:phosphoribosylglycinamide formyltransferase-1
MNIAIFASGNGSNFQAIAYAIKRKELDANLVLLVCDKEGAFVLERAKKFSVKSILIKRKDFTTKEDFEKEIIKHCKQEKVDLIVLAGFMRIIGAQLLDAYKNKIINIHPALLPKFKGAYAIKDAFEAKVKTTGVTVHFVDEEMDHGPIILQKSVKIEETDTLKSLEEKIHKVEHRLYPTAIKLFIEGKLKIRGRNKN